MALNLAHFVVVVHLLLPQHSLACVRDAKGDTCFTKAYGACRADGTVEVRSVTDRAVYSKVVVCAGRETARLARSVGLSLPVRLAAHVRLTFDVKAAAPARARAARTRKISERVSPRCPVLTR